MATRYALVKSSWFPPSDASSLENIGGDQISGSLTPAMVDNNRSYGFSAVLFGPSVSYLE